MPTSSSHPSIKAHRGASLAAPENTSSAVRLAFQQGADACEIDVRVSSDGVVVVFHDEDTKRVGGRDRRVDEQSLEELRELDVGAWKDRAYVGERVATLAEILALVPAGKTLFVEIKDGVEAVPTVLGTIESTPTKGNVAIESFSPEVLQAIGKVMPALSLHLTVGVQKDQSGLRMAFPIALAQQAKEAGFDGLAVDVRGVTRAFAQAVRDQGLELAVWTVNEPAAIRELRDLPITWIETDAPAAIASALRATRK